MSYMVTFDEFLTDFNEEVEETFEEAAMTDNAKIAVVTTMRKYLGNMRFDPLELMGLFETVCYSAMRNGQVNRRDITARFKQEANKFLTTDSQYASEPEITFDEVEERRSFGR